jgi:calcium-dependent protein kinase
MGCSPVRIPAYKKNILHSYNSIERNNNVYNTNINNNKHQVQCIKISESLFIKERKCNPNIYYETISILGQGTFGKVYKVFLKNTSPPIYRAMKHIEKSKQQLISAISLLNEIEILKELDHPNILKIYEYYTTNDSIYIISELCEGGELFDKITEEKYFTEKCAKIIMKQLFSAIEFCHLNKVIHRDLKPENILLIKKEITSIYDFQIKLIDFGTSVRVKHETMLNKNIGTPFYVAPEVLNNNYNEKCDMWSLGVIMYILLYGVPPFYGNNDEEIYEKVMKGEFDFKNDKYSIIISNQARDLIKCLIEKDIKKRLSSSQALEHEWIRSLDIDCRNSYSSTETTDSKIILKVSQNLRNFYATQKLQQMTLAFIVHNLVNLNDIQNLYHVFMKFDVNGDGRLTKEELMNGLVNVIGKTNAQNEIDRLMKVIDMDCNGYIEYEEFIRATMDKDKLLSKKNLKYCFDFVDENKNGKISCNEIKAILDKDNTIADEVWKALVDEVDLDGDGEINFEEFVIMMNNSKFNS